MMTAVASADRRRLWWRQVLTLTRREVQDSLRDWRIFVPIFILTLAFPLLMNFITVRTQNMFYERWGVAGIETRLLPLMLMLVGFFPASVSLVIALETFVGEKERKSLEPLLATPLSDLQLYIGKTLAAMTLPLAAGALGISVYLVMLWRQGGWMPSPLLLFQVVVLTIAEALVMVSSAVVVSSQTTSVRAANLLASFIVIPMALLVQGESLVVLQAGNSVLWAILAFLIIADVMLVRMGLRLFNREGLLGREIDEPNLGNLWRTFRRHLVWPRWLFGADVDRLPRPLRWLSTWTGLYFRELPAALKRSRLAILLVVVALLGSLVVGRILAERLPLPPESLTLDSITAESFSTTSWLPAFTTWGVLGNNVRSLASAALLGVLSFGALAVALLMAPMAIIAYMAFQVARAGYDPLLFVLTFVMPHGILELPAAIVATALAVRLGAVFIAPPRGMTVGEAWLQALADFVKVFVAFVVPLLALAAWIEVHVSPALVLMVYGR